MKWSFYIPTPVKTQQFHTTCNFNLIYKEYCVPPPTSLQGYMMLICPVTGGVKFDHGVKVVSTRAVHCRGVSFFL